MLRIAEQPHAQFRLFQRALALAIEADAAFVGGQRFLQAHFAVFHLFDQLLERIERGLEIGDRGGFGCGFAGHGRSVRADRGRVNPTTRAWLPCARSQASNSREQATSPAARTTPRRIREQRHALTLPWRNAEVLQDVLERMRMRAPGKRDALATPACVNPQVATESHVRGRSNGRIRGTRCRRWAAARVRDHPTSSCQSCGSGNRFQSA